MHHRHLAHRPATRSHSSPRSPLGELEQAFLALAQAAEPLTFPARLVCDDPDRAAWPVDRVRTHLAHPSTRAELREQTWREVVRRARDLSEPWGVVAVAMTVPVLRRMLARLARAPRPPQAVDGQPPGWSMQSSQRTMTSNSLSSPFRATVAR